MGKGRRPDSVGGKRGNYSTQNNVQKTQKARDARALDRREENIKMNEAASKERTRALDQREADIKTKEAEISCKERKSAHEEEAMTGAEKATNSSDEQRMAHAAQQVSELQPRQGELLTSSDSKTVLLLYYGHVRDGFSRNQALLKVSGLFRSACALCKVPCSLHMMAVDCFCLFYPMPHCCVVHSFLSILFIPHHTHYLWYDTVLLHSIWYCTVPLSVPYCCLYRTVVCCTVFCTAFACKMISPIIALGHAHFILRRAHTIA